MTGLDALIAAVEAGTALWADFRGAMVHPSPRNAFDAYNGSLDAAHRLHDALLPGWVGSSDTEGFAKVGQGSRGVQTVMYYERIDGHPARSWLLAILRALKAQGETS